MQKMRTVDVAARRVVRVLPRERPFLLVSAIRRIRPNIHTMTGGGMAFGRPFFTNRFPKGPIVPNILVIRTLTRANTITVLSRPR